MLILPIKKKWFDMILSGEKKEEYREIKPYYTTRFVNAGLLEHTFNKNCTAPTYNRTVIMFRNGYSSNSPSFTAKVGLVIGAGRPEWGAEPGRKYYVLKILDLLALDKRDELRKEVANIESIMVKRPFICKKCGASFERTLPRFTSIYPLCDKCMGLKAQEEPIMLSCVERS